MLHLSQRAQIFAGRIGLPKIHQKRHFRQSIVLGFSRIPNDLSDSAINLSQQTDHNFDRRHFHLRDMANSTLSHDNWEIQKVETKCSTWLRGHERPGNAHLSLLLGQKEQIGIKCKQFLHELLVFTEWREIQKILSWERRDSWFASQQKWWQGSWAEDEDFQIHLTH